MRTTRLGAVLASLAITTGTAAVLAAAPAQAATPVTVTLQLGGEHKVIATYKDYVGFFSGSVSYTQDDESTAAVTAGASVLQQSYPGKGWHDVRTDDDGLPGALDFGTYGSHAARTVQYRVHYLGGTDGVTTWDPAYSNTVTVYTLWNLHENGTCNGGCRMFGKLSPKARHHKVTIQVKHGTWKRYKVVRTNGRSHWNAKVVATRGKGTLYRAVVAGNKQEVATASGIYRFYKVVSRRAAVSRR